MLLVGGCLIVRCLPAQTNSQAFSLPRAERGLYALCEQIDPQGWFFFKPTAHLSSEKLFTTHAHQLGLSIHDKMVLVHETVDPDGVRHQRYQQVHRGVPIEQAFFTLHGHSQDVRIAHGHLAPQIDHLTQPELSLFGAQQILASVFGDMTLAAESQEWEQARQAEPANGVSTWQPQGKLVFFPVVHLGETHYRLAYRFEVRTLTPDSHFTCWIDAHDGHVLHRQSLRYACREVSGHGELHFYGRQTLAMRDRDFPNYDYSLETCDNESIHTKYYSLNSFGEPRSWSWISSIDHNRTDWGERHQRATTSHWTAQKSWQYFADAHGWVGPDGQGGELRVLVDWQAPAGMAENTAWYEADGSRHYIYLGRQDDLPMATLDIMGHEYAHAVISTACDLGYERETGALHEGLADIFGVLVEAYATNGQHDWIFGKEVGGLRSFSHPKDYAQPSVYLDDEFWISTNEVDCPSPSTNPLPQGNDNCGIHTNSGVINHWFYLLANGGQQQGINVSGLGLTVGADIVFRMVQAYLDPTSNFADARIASIQAATDLFGTCSNEIVQVRNAWAAVGVGPANNLLCVQINGPAQICADEQNTFEANAAAGATFTWTPLPAGVEYEIAGNRNQFLIVRSIADSLEDIPLTVQARLDSQVASNSRTLPLAYCKNLSPITRQPLPLETETWTVYPNPASEMMEVFLQEGYFPGKLSLYDATGHFLWQRTALERSLSLDLSGLTAGTYYLQLQGPAGREVKALRVLP